MNTEPRFCDMCETVITDESPGKCPGYTIQLWSGSEIRQTYAVETESDAILQFMNLAECADPTGVYRYRNLDNRIWLVRRELDKYGRFVKWFNGYKVSIYQVGFDMKTYRIDKHSDAIELIDSCCMDAPAIGGFGGV